MVTHEQFVVPKSEIWYWEEAADRSDTSRAEILARFHRQSLTGASLSLRPWRGEESNWVMLATVSAAERMPLASYNRVLEHHIEMYGEHVRFSFVTFATVYRVAYEESYSGAILNFSLTNSEIVGKRSWYIEYVGLDGIPAVEFTLELRGYSPSFEAFFPEPAQISLILAFCHTLLRRRPRKGKANNMAK